MRALSHAINNPVTALLGRAQMLSARNHDDPHVAKTAVVLEESASRVADLARSLSALLRKATQAAAG
jgi:nitrogen-specific signal transduction histidine kinase